MFAFGRVWTCSSVCTPVICPVWGFVLPHGYLATSVACALMRAEQMSVPDAASLAVKGFVAPLLLWRGWEDNKSEVERLGEFLDYGRGLPGDVEHLAVEDFEDLQIDLNRVNADFLNIQRKPALLRWSGYQQYADDLAALKRRVEEVARRFGQKLSIDTNRKMTTTERYQRKVVSWKKRGNLMVCG